MRRVFSWLTARLVPLMGSAMLTVAIAAAVAQSRPVPAPRSANPVAIEAAEAATLNALQHAFIRIADRVEPAVVTIDAVEKSGTVSDPRTSASLSPPPPEEVLPEGSAGDEGESSGGSGIIVREERGSAYVLTNQHVIEDCDQIRVRLHSRREYRAEIVGEDEVTDLAVLRFRPAQPLGPRCIARLGDSDRVRVGQYAIAIGSPLGYDSTFTKGVVSAKGRDLDDVDGEKDYRGLLQTDASINPGNSGGPLVNIDGEVVGINVAIASPTGSNVGLGFAIPSNTAKRVMTELIEHGTVTRGYLGVSTARENEELSLELQQFYGVESGALIENVSAHTPAALAGLRSEDVVTQFDGRPIHDYGDLIDAVQNTPPGKRVELRLMRERRPIAVALTLAASRSPRVLPRREESAPAKPQHAKDYGLTVGPGRGDGVAVRSVASDGAAAEAGLEAGDTILRCGTTPIHGLADWHAALSAAGHDTSLVLKLRKTETGSAAIVVVHPEA